MARLTADRPFQDLTGIVTLSTAHSEAFFAFALFDHLKTGSD